MSQKTSIIIESDFTIEDENSPTLEESMMLKPVKLLKTNSEVSRSEENESNDNNNKNEEISSDSYLQLGKHLSDSENSLN